MVYLGLPIKNGDFWWFSMAMLVNRLGPVSAPFTTGALFNPPKSTLKMSRFLGSPNGGKTFGKKRCFFYWNVWDGIISNDIILLDIICVYVHVYMCICVCMCACLPACMHACMHLCMYACMHVCMYVWMYVCTVLYRTILSYYCTVLLYCTITVLY